MDTLFDCIFSLFAIIGIVIIFIGLFENELFLRITGFALLVIDIAWLSTSSIWMTLLVAVILVFFIFVIGFIVQKRDKS